MSFMDILDQLSAIRHYIAVGLTLLVAILGSVHVVLYKRDSRAAILWVGFIWLAPILGAAIYLLLGVNRIRRRAVALGRGKLGKNQPPTPVSNPPVEWGGRFGTNGAHLDMLERLVQEVVRRPLLDGNTVEPLVNGDEAFPAMLEAIEDARESIALSTYIFDRGKAGRAFVSALGAAVARGVAVRVLVDDTGARYSWPSIMPLLRRARVPAARFLPTFAPLRVMAINLRNHRKLLVADGRVGFAGGMNIRDGHWLGLHPKRPVQDLQFRVEGPVVAQMQEIFAEDWEFTTGEELSGEKWFPRLEVAGGMLARGISDGPDEDFDKLRWTLLGALSCARSSVRIVTPYFLPDQALVSALNIAAMRGVEVDIILPSQNNLPFVQWAMSAQLWQVLQRGCRVWLAPPPFDHSKLMLVDGCWALIGSANWDPRSLRLNFEFNIECYDCKLVSRLDGLVRDKLRNARRLTLEDADGRPLPVKLRDGVARLLTPFL